MAKGFAFLEPIQPGKEMSVRMVGEGASGLSAPFEDEDEHELKILAKSNILID